MTNNLKLSTFVVSISLPDGQTDVQTVQALDEWKARSAAMLRTTVRCNGQLVTYDVKPACGDCGTVHTAEHECEPLSTWQQTARGTSGQAAVDAYDSLFGANAAPRRQPVAKSAVHVNTFRLEVAHGKSPRGYGSWAFAADDLKTFWHTGRYAEAKHAAVTHFAALGVTSITVLS